MPRDWEKQTEYKENRQLTEDSCPVFSIPKSGGQRALEKKMF